MDLNDIVVFTKVAETKSFTGAADALGLPKSTVSRKLAQLEERLGVRLVQRTTRKLALTDIGEMYYERCKGIVHDVLEAEKLVTDMQATPRGRLRITATVDFSTRWLGDIVASFLAQHSEINIEHEATDEVVDLIDDGYYVAVRDVALAGGGVALLSEFMIADDLAAGRRVRVLPEWRTRLTEVHAVYPARHNLPPRLTLFLDHLAKALSPPPWERA